MRRHLPAKDVQKLLDERQNRKVIAIFLGIIYSAISPSVRLFAKRYMRYALLMSIVISGVSGLAIVAFFFIMPTAMQFFPSLAHAPRFSWLCESHGPE